MSWELGRLPADSVASGQERNEGKAWQTEGKLGASAWEMQAVFSQGRWSGTPWTKRRDVRLSGTGCGLPFSKGRGGPLEGVFGKISFCL